ncbi:MAG: hypothetical protein ACRD3J_16880 [Thermoanaerobaculia bacterium]
MNETPARPSDELLARLYDGKRALHTAQRHLPLPEKVRQVLDLQKITYEILRARGVELRPWERPWEVEP